MFLLCFFFFSIEVIREVATCLLWKRTPKLVCAPNRADFVSTSFFSLFLGYLKSLSIWPFGSVPNVVTILLRNVLAKTKKKKQELCAFQFIVCVTCWKCCIVAVLVVVVEATFIDFLQNKF